MLYIVHTPCHGAFPFCASPYQKGKNKINISFSQWLISIGKKKKENVRLPMISSLPGSQVRGQFDEQSTGNLQLPSSHGQADFEKKKKDVNT